MDFPIENGHVPELCKRLPEGKTLLKPIKPSFSYGFPMVFQRLLTIWRVGHRALDPDLHHEAPGAAGPVAPCAPALRNARAADVGAQGGGDGSSCWVMDIVVIVT